MAEGPQQELLASAQTTFLHLLSAKLRLLIGSLQTGDPVPPSLLADGTICAPSFAVERNLQRARQ